VTRAHALTAAGVNAHALAVAVEKTIR